MTDDTHVRASQVYRLGRGWRLTERAWRKAWLVVALGSACADSAAGSHDASIDAAVSDAAVSDGPRIVEACRPLTGDAPFGRVLAGEGVFAIKDGPPMPAGMSVHAYFPGGRRPGQSLYLALHIQHPQRPWLAVTGPFMIDENGGIAASEVTGPRFYDGYGTVFFKGALIAPDRGLDGEGHINFAVLSDVAVTGYAAFLRLCPTDDPLPPASLVGDNLPMAPTQSLRLVPSAPIDPADLDAVEVRADGKPVPVDLALGEALVVTPRSAFPPGKVITLELHGLTDRIGRAVSVSNVPAPLVTTATVTDLGFDEPPPAGAMASWGLVTLANDRLRVGGEHASARALVALGDPGVDHTHARLRLHVMCPGALLGSTIALVTARGDVSRVPLTCDLEKDEIVPLPGPGPLWLSIVVTRIPGHHQHTPPPLANIVSLDEITFD